LVAGSKKLAPAPKFWDWLSLVVNGSLNVWTVGATLFTVIVVVAVALAPKLSVTTTWIVAEDKPSPFESLSDGLTLETFAIVTDKSAAPVLAYSNRSRPLGFHTLFDSGRNRYRMNARASSACVDLADTATAESIHAPSSAGNGPTSSISL